MSEEILIIGAGAAGLFCAFQAAERGCKVLVMEKQPRPGLKILISGGGRCNFTNLKVDPSNFTSQNPHFCKSALARYTPSDFIALMEQHDIAYHEKHRGQLFCNTSSKEIVGMLLKECEKTGVRINYGVTVKSVEKKEDIFYVTTIGETISTKNLVIATGGLSYKNLGATDLGYQIARSFGHEIIPTQPALTPLLWSDADRKRWGELAGLACPATVSTQTITEADDLLFTHNGLSGPVILRITLHWRAGDPLWINFFPGHDLPALLKQKKVEGGRALMKNILSQWIPARLAEALAMEPDMERPLNEIAMGRLEDFGERLQHYPIHPAALDGYAKAEVTAGGVSTDQLSSKTMESKICAGLYFIGEVVDVTGDLGGFNFQWAWASAFAAAEALGAFHDSVPY